MDLGRYVVFDEIASGGMSSVHFGRMLGPAGFGRTVAIKRLHPHYAKDPDFVSMMLDEARLVSRIHHPNVVPTLDIVHTKSDLFLVMEYVPGETLTSIRRLATAQGVAIPQAVALAIATNILLGLDAAHEATSEDGKPLGIIHRDVSPQNVLVGVDGSARLLDFGIARAAGASHHSDGGQVKGKVAYMSPEQLRLDPDLARQTDVYAASVVLWEMLTGRRLFEGAQRDQIAFLVLSGAVRSPRTVNEAISEELEDLVMRGLERMPADRFATAREMAVSLEACGRVATAREVAEWLAAIAADSLGERAAVVSRIEKETATRVDLRALATQIAEGNVSEGRSLAPVVEPTMINPPEPVVVFEEPPRSRGRAVAIAGALALVVVVVFALLHATRTTAASLPPPPQVIAAVAEPTPPPAPQMPVSAPVIVAPVSASPRPRNAPTFRTGREKPAAPRPAPSTGHELFDRN
jgi:eukaryotic-like serine/threonine-protein kinase